MTPFEREIASLIIDKLMLTGVTPETMEAEGSLVDDYGLDSVDLLELAMALGKKYGVEFEDGSDENIAAFTSIRSLSAHVDANRVQNIEPAKSFDEIAFQEVVGGLSEMFGFSLESLNRDTQLVEELDLDSLDALDLVVRLQDTMDTRIPDERLVELRTIGDVVDVIVELRGSAKAS